MNFLTVIRKILRYQSSWKSVHFELRCSLPAGGQTDRQTLRS